MQPNRPAIYIRDFPRTATRETWKYYYRKMRVINREVWKQTADVMLYGIGFMQHNADGDPECISPSEFFNGQT